VIRLQTEPIGVDELIAAARGDGDGAVVVFLGSVRERNQDRRVLRLEYHAYPEMARDELGRIEAEALRRFDVSAVVAVHRTGELGIGETSVAVVVAADHRDAAFAACRFVIDTIKQRVPIWKKEFFEGGQVWIEQPPQAPR